jgi:hypothetical protein
MREPGLAEYLSKERRTAQEAIASTEAMWRWRPALMVVLIGIAAIMPFGGRPGTEWFGWLDAVFLVAISVYTIYSHYFAPIKSHEVIPLASQEIKANLMEHGLLLQVVEPSYELSLQRRWNSGTGLFGVVRPFPTGATSALRARLEALASNYCACCRQAGLTTKLAQRVQAEGGKTGAALLRAVVLLNLAEVLELDVALPGRLTSDPLSQQRGSTGDW